MPDPHIWHPLFQFLRDELFPLLGGGGSVVGNEWLDLFHDSSYFAGGIFGKSLYDDHPYGFTVGQLSDADEWRHGALLAPVADGYVIELLGVKMPAGGIMDLYLDETYLQTFDFYADPQEVNTNFQYIAPAMYFPETRTYVLRGVTNGQNVSSSGYECQITKIGIYPYVP